MEKFRTHLFCIFLFVFTIGSTAPSIGARQPPPEAIEACASISQNDACSVTTPNGSLDGVCQSPPGLDVLACVPKGGPKDGPKSGGQKENPSAQLKDQTQGLTSSTTRRPTRSHKIIQSDGQLNLVDSTEYPITNSYFDIDSANQERVIISNGIAEHLTGNFPNPDNPNSIQTQDYYYRVPLAPNFSTQTISQQGYLFGVAINGVPFDPSAAEWYLGIERSRWQYNALSGAIPLGLDESHAHVQPGGQYHYHAQPTLLLDNQSISSHSHSPIIGWAADGFPVYSLYGYLNSIQSNFEVIEQTSSYQIRDGSRPSGSEDPGGYYDGTFVVDYEYIEGSGSLDDCNGRLTITPEYPQGTYAYFLTRYFPVIPRCFHAEPSEDFSKRQN